MLVITADTVKRYSGQNIIYNELNKQNTEGSISTDIGSKVNK